MEESISSSPMAEMTRLQMERKEMRKWRWCNEVDSNRLILKIFSICFISKFSFVLIAPAFDYYSPKSVELSSDHRQSAMMYDTKAFKLKREAKELEKKMKRFGSAFMKIYNRILEVIAFKHHCNISRLNCGMAPKMK